MNKRMILLKDNLKNNSKFSSIDEVFNFIRENSKIKFEETLAIDIRLGVNRKKKSIENIRGNVILAHGIEKKIKVAVITSKDKIEEAKKAGADFVGSEELIEEIRSKGKVFFDVCFSTPDFASNLVKIAKILGSSKCMPNMKDGTITNNLKESIQNIKFGKNLKINNDSHGHIRLPIGKINFSNEKLKHNLKIIRMFLETNKPVKMKTLFEKIVISSSMGLGINIPISLLLNV